MRRRWLLNVRPAAGDGTAAPIKPASSPATIGQAVADMGQGPVDWALRVAYAMTEHIIDEVPEMGGGAGPFETLRMGTESTTLQALRVVVHDDPSMWHATDEALEGDRDFVHRGIALERVLRAVRLGHGFMAREFLAAAESLLSDPSERSAELQAISTLLFGYIDYFSSRMAETYLAEKARWERSAAAGREQLVRAILAGQPVDVPKAEVTLGYGLSQHHIAYIVWTEDSPAGADPAELHRISGQVALALSGGEPLRIEVGPVASWCWTARRERFDVDDKPLRELITRNAGVRVAVGTVESGLEGFRRSHEAAADAEAMARLAPPSQGNDVVCYADVRLVAALAANAGTARRFMVSELGALAEDGPYLAELRDTLLAYLDCGRSASAAAERLHVARNTVLYRVKRAEKLLGRPAGRGCLGLHAALTAVHVLGIAFVRPDDPETSGHDPLSSAG